MMRNNRRYVQVSSTEVICIEIRGKGGKGRVLDDGGLIDRLWQWEMENSIYPFKCMMAGAGRYVAIYYPEDGREVRRWLKNQKKN